ncbi:hypothetical protein [Sutcliffiella horikoshii]|uniref:hypothetical protein n=1 Tax=Sutcliffiella horikoshii TaxID=79883 RepID=UPI001CFDBFE4|nr:hypothetical protein [Sutcliffiella horikoshii]
MHTIVIQLQDVPQDWHLIEPFFYKVQSAGQLSIYQVEDGNSYDKLYHEITHHMSQFRVTKWQAVVLTTVPCAKLNTKRLTCLLQEMREKFFRQFIEHELPPRTVAFLMLDPIKRTANFAPDDGESNPYWQLDNEGYYFDEIPVSHPANMFVQRELEELDATWGNQLNLTEAGRIDRPDPAFISVLVEKINRVSGKFIEIIREKKEMLYRENIHGEKLMLAELESLEASFLQLLQRKKIPPLVEELANFAPSAILKELLKERLSIQSAIGDYRIIRQTSAIYSVEKRTTALINIALFLNAVAFKEHILSQISPGGIFELEVVLRSGKLEEMLSGYDSSLHAARTKIESKLLDRQELTHNRFEEVQVQPYSTEPLKDNEDLSAPIFKISNQETYMLEWERYMNGVSAELKNREKDMISGARAGAKKIQQLKRRKSVLDEEKVEITEYLEELKDKVDTLYAELDENEPGQSVEAKEWEKHEKVANFYMEIYSRACPTKKQVAIAMGVSGLMLLAPQLFSLDWSTIDFRNNWLSYSIVPGGLLFGVFAIGFLVKSYMLRPVERLSKKSEDKRKELLQSQQESHRKYNNYLNKMYELYRTRQYYETVKAHYERIKRENHQLRYHQSRVDEFLDTCGRLIKNLGLSPKLNKEYHDFFETKFKSDVDVSQSPIYSPFDCQIEKETELEKLSISVGKQKSSVHAGYLHVIQELRLVKDQVYKL